MGGRGVWSYSSKMGRERDQSPLTEFAAASLNRGTAAGTSPAAAVERFREQMMGQKVEYSAYVDDSGYVHALASSGNKSSTDVAPIAAVAKERGVSTVVHNHPHGAANRRSWGGPLSGDDLTYIARAYALTGGKVDRMVATAREGTYAAKVTKRVTPGQVSRAISRAEKAVESKKYPSEIGMWRAVHGAYAAEFGKIGVEITFTPGKKKNGRLVTQKIGEFL